MNKQVIVDMVTDLTNALTNDEDVSRKTRKAMLNIVILAIECNKYDPGTEEFLKLMTDYS